MTSMANLAANSHKAGQTDSRCRVFRSMTYLGAVSLLHRLGYAGIFFLFGLEEACEGVFEPMNLGLIIWNHGSWDLCG